MLVMSSLPTATTSTVNPCHLLHLRSSYDITYAVTHWSSHYLSATASSFIMLCQRCSCMTVVELSPASPADLITTVLVSHPQLLHPCLRCRPYLDTYQFINAMRVHEGFEGQCFLMSPPMMSSPSVYFQVPPIAEVQSSCSWSRIMYDMVRWLTVHHCLHPTPALRDVPILCVRSQLVTPRYWDTADWQQLGT